MVMRGQTPTNQGVAKPINLIEECPEVMHWAEGVINSIDRYKLFPDENFASLLVGVMSSTSTDKQGESFELEDLERTVARVEQSAFWVRREHDPLIQPIGRTLVAKLFFEANSNVHFVASVTGMYDSSKLPKLSDKGIDLSKLPNTAPEELQDQEPKIGASLEFNPDEIPVEVIEQVLDTAPSWVLRQPTQDFRKSGEPLRILVISASILLLSSSPFTKKFLERWGEKTADASFEFLKWLRKKISSLRVQDRLVIRTGYRGCEIEFVLPAEKNPVIVAEAVDALRSATDSACRLVEALAEFEPTRVTLGYDLPSKKWFPLHSTTLKAGIIADQPRLIAIERLHSGGLSLGGKREQRLP
jgi:hypothetical protein